MLLSEKQEYIAIDFVRIICALLVFSIHISAFENGDSEAAFWFEQILCRLAVPFFFVTSGYFIAPKINSGNRVRQYVLRILQLYVLYTCLYLPQILYSFRKEGLTKREAVSTFVKRFFLAGSYGSLWYFVALIVATGILYLFATRWKWSRLKILGVSGIFYIIGVLGLTYRKVFVNIPILQDFIRVYESVFETTRNGLFFGLFFVCMGYCIREYNARIENRFYGLGVLCAFSIMNVEAYLARYLFYCEEQDMLFSTALVVPLLFLAVCFVKVSDKYLKSGFFLRHLSVLVFGLHLFVRFYAYYIIQNLVGLPLKGMAYYLTMLGLTCGVSGMIIILSKNKYFFWLKYMY